MLINKIYETTILKFTPSIEFDIINTIIITVAINNIVTIIVGGYSFLLIANIFCTNRRQALYVFQDISYVNTGFQQKTSQEFEQQ